MIPLTSTRAAAAASLRSSGVCSSQSLGGRPVPYARVRTANSAAPHSLAWAPVAQLGLACKAARLTDRLDRNACTEFPGRVAVEVRGRSVAVSGGFVQMAAPGLAGGVASPDDVSGRGVTSELCRGAIRCVYRHSVCVLLVI